MSKRIKIVNFRKKDKFNTNSKNLRMYEKVSSQFTTLKIEKGYPILHKIKKYTGFPCFSWGNVSEKLQYANTKTHILGLNKA